MNEIEIRKCECAMEIFEHLDVIENHNAIHDSLQPIQIINDKYVHRNPFEYMAIDDNQFLMQIKGRSCCPKCGKSRKFFCYTCYVAIKELDQYLPTVQLPIQIDIIKHQREVDGKSTAIHAAILARRNVNIYTYPNIPDYHLGDDAEKTVCITINSSLFSIEINRNLIRFDFNFVGFNISDTQFDPCGWHF